MAQEHETRLVICVTGPESTGKTTLARRLAGMLRAPLVEEVARTWLTDRACGAQSSSELADAGRTAVRYEYGPEDVLAIARAQMAAEQAAVESGAPLIVTDTDLTVIRIWWEEKYGVLDPWLADAVRNLARRRYLLMMPDIPWEPDPLRESPHDRERLFLRYRLLLTEIGLPFAEVGGTGAARFEAALATVRQWLTDPAPRGRRETAP